MNGGVEWWLSGNRRGNVRQLCPHLTFRIQTPVSCSGYDTSVPGSGNTTSNTLYRTSATSASVTTLTAVSRRAALVVKGGDDDVPAGGCCSNCAAPSRAAVRHTGAAVSCVNVGWFALLVNPVGRHVLTWLGRAYVHNGLVRLS